MGRLAQARNHNNIQHAPCKTATYIPQLSCRERQPTQLAARSAARLGFAVCTCLVGCAAESAGDSLRATHSGRKSTQPVR